MVNFCCVKMDVEDKVHGFWHFRTFRFHLTIVMCCSMLANGLVRSTLSMAMVCMVNSTAVPIKDNQDYLGQMDYNNSTMESMKNMVPEGCDAPDLISAEYDGTLTWSSSQQGVLFSAIYWGGAFSGLPAGWLANRYSPKLMVMICFVLLMAGSMLSPLAATDSSIVPMFIIRFIMGIGGQGAINPAITVIISRWIPKEGQSTVLALYTAGNQIAMIIGMPMNAYLCRQKQFLGGWPSIFYVNGFCVLLAAVLWYIFVDDNPSESRWLAEAERKYINGRLQSDYARRKHVTGHVPWRKLLTSMPLWSCILGSFAGTAVGATMSSYLPTYYKEALHFDLKRNGILSAVPYVAQWLAKVAMAVIADYMKSHTKFSHNIICKIFNSIGSFVVAAFLIAAGYMDCTGTIWAVVFVTLANSAFSASCPGWLTSLMCIAPAYTGIVNGIARFAGQVSSVLSPYIVGLVTVHGTASEWRLVFYIMAAILVAAGLHFVFFGTVDVEEWAKSELDNGHIGVESALVEREMTVINKPSNANSPENNERKKEDGEELSLVQTGS